MVKHFSHRHDLEVCTAMPRAAGHEDDEEEALLCSICGYELEDLHHSDDANVYPVIYQCSKSCNSKCRFYAHELCLQLPREILHNSHPKHPLLLLNDNDNDNDNREFVCNACGGSSAASYFRFHCPKCKFDLHLQCATLPQTLSHHEHHQHALTLLFSAPNSRDDVQQKMSRICGLCKDSIFEGCWLYYCRECDYGTHVDCLTAAHDDHHHHK